MDTPPPTTNRSPVVAILDLMTTEELRTLMMACFRLLRKRAEEAAIRRN